MEKEIKKIGKVFETLNVKEKSDDKFKYECKLSLYETYKLANIDLINLNIQKQDKTFFDLEKKILYYNEKDDLHFIEYELIYKVLEKMIDLLEFETREEKINIMFDLLYKAELIELDYEIVVYSEEEIISKLTKLFIINNR